MKGPLNPSGYWPLLWEWYQYVPGWSTYGGLVGFSYVQAHGHRAYHKVIGEPRARSNGTLGDLHWTIHMRGTVHEQSVEVQRCRLIPQGVEDVDNYSVTEGDLYSRDGPLAVDANDRPICFAIWICRNPTNVEVIGYGCSHRKRYARQKGERKE